MSLTNIKVSSQYSAHLDRFDAYLLASSIMSPIIPGERNGG